MPSISTRPPLHATSPRSAAHLAPSVATHGGFPPSTVPARPQSASSATATATTTALAPSVRPKRPLSALRVLSPPKFTGSHVPVSPRHRPASASRVRATATTSTLARRVDNGIDSDDIDVDTIAIAIPVARIRHDVSLDGATGPPGDGTSVSCPDVQSEDGTGELDHAALAEAEAFLLAWQNEEASFRSPLLFAEASFAQAKAMTSRGWSSPNVFLSSIAFGSLELFCQSLERHHPFLVELTDAVGAALFANFRELRRAQINPRGHNVTTTARFLQYVQHGQYCFQQLRDHEELLETWRRAAQTAKRENQRLSEQLQKQHVARLFDRVQARVKTAASSAASTVVRVAAEDSQPYPQLRRMLFGDQRGARLDLQAGDYDFEPTCEEILLVFNSLRPAEASKLLMRMQAKACEQQLPLLAESYATAVDMLPEHERRKFLSEYFQLVAAEELKDALQARDETNQEKQWGTFLDEMKDALRIQETPHGSFNQPMQTPQFHSDEARVGAGVYELVDLVEELAAEVSLADSKKPLMLSPDLITRLKPYQSLKKKMEKAKQLMTAIPLDVPPLTESTACGCVCGKHRLVVADDVDHHDAANSSVAANPVPVTINRLREHDVDEYFARKKKSVSAEKRISVSGKSTTRRKSSMNGVSARVSTRNSMATVRLFPLSEVCHLISSVVQLHFARESGDVLSGRRSSVRNTSRKASVPPVPFPRPSFKALAKDLLTRKYGIKSIAVLHMLQLEKSLVHFGATDKHVRCELFAWFIGADKTRSHYKDLAFQFYLRVVKAVIAMLLKKPLDAVSYADLIAVWTEQIGDADTSSGATAPKTLTGTQCVDVCNSVFPAWMKESSAFTLLVERSKAATESIEVEHFAKRAMVAWETQLIKAHAQIQETFAREANTDIDELGYTLFAKCVAACGLELTSGQLLEYYDNLLGEDDTGVAMHKAVQFVMEQKHQ